MSSHSDRCRSLNYLGSGEDFDCICADPPDSFAPRAKPRASGALVPLPPDAGVLELLERVGAAGRCSRESTWLYWFRTACNAAENSLCSKSKCGAALVGVRDSEPLSLWKGSLISTGCNGPPQCDPAYRRCFQTTPSKAHPKAGRTCCVHAEVRALLAAPRNGILGSTLYFARTDQAGNLLYSGRPWCTECSKLALDLGVKTWVLWHADGPREYEAAEYDHLSNQYDEEERRARERGESSDFHAHLVSAEKTES